MRDLRGFVLDWRVASGWLVAVLSLVYVPAVGHGFVKDDFGWVGTSNLAAWQQFVWSAPMGFFRPLVALSFALNRAACGVDHPFCYGMTNYLLLLACAVGVYAVGRSLGLARGAAILAAALWAFNWHGINMAVLWISGRTALLLVLFATASAAALLASRPILAVFLLAAAMLAKEEALTFGVTLVVLGGIARRRGLIERRHAYLTFVAGTIVASILYLWLRSQSGAMTPASAPSYYRIDVSASRLLANAPEYLDRSATAAVVVVLAFLGLFRPRLVGSARDSRFLLAVGLCWLVGSLVLTVFLPVRSSLYACLPSVGVAVSCAGAVRLLWSGLSDRRKSASVAAGLLLPLLLLPVYAARNSRFVGEAELSHDVLAKLQDVATARGAGAVVCLHDDPRSKPSLSASFGGGLATAVALNVSPPVTVWVDSVGGDGATAVGRPSRCDAEFEVSGRDIRPFDPDGPLGPR